MGGSKYYTYARTVSFAWGDGYRNLPAVLLRKDTPIFEFYQALVELSEVAKLPKPLPKIILDETGMVAVMSTSVIKGETIRLCDGYWLTADAEESLTVFNLRSDHSVVRTAMIRKDD